MDEYLRSRDMGEVVLTDEFGKDIDLKNRAVLPEQIVKGRFSIQKRASFPIYFTEKGLVEHLESSTAVEAVIGLLFTENGFRTEYTSFLGESEISAASQATGVTAPVADVPGLVKALNAEAISYLPVSSGFWLANENTATPEWWKKLSSAKLLCTFCKELRITVHSAELTFLSDRRITVVIPLHADRLAESYAQIQVMAKWLFQDKKGGDTRHSLLNNQVGLLSISDTELIATNLKPVAEKILSGGDGLPLLSAGYEQGTV